MDVFSKLGKVWDTNSQNLCHNVITAYSERVALDNVTQISKFRNLSVCELLYFLHTKQKLLVESCKDKLVELQERA